MSSFYEGQPDSIVSGIEVVSMDASAAYSAATRTHAPQATICYDPFHIMQWINRAPWIGCMPRPPPGPDRPR